MSTASSCRAAYLFCVCIGIALSCAGNSAAQEQQLRHFAAHHEFLGWSKDGRYAVWYDPIFNPHYLTSNGPSAQGVGDDCAIHLAWVLDTRRGSLTKYLMDASIAKPLHENYEDHLQWPLKSPIECANPDPDSLIGRSEDAIRQRAAYPGLLEKYRKEYAQVPGPKALRGLLQGALPLAGSKRTSPDGTLRLDVEITSKRPVPHKWKGARLQVGKGYLSDDPHVYGAVLRFLVKRAADVTGAISVPLPDDKISFLSWNTFTPVWSPDGRHLAVVYELTDNIKRGSFEMATAILPTLGPKIELACAQGQLARAREVVGDALYRAGHSLLSAEAVPAKELSPQTLILALDGHEAAARAIAALLPGGAEVRKQTAPTSFHLTIKLGGSIPLPAAPSAK